MNNDNQKLNNNSIQDSDDTLNLAVSDEILIKDKDGSFKILIDGKKQNLNDKAKTNEVKIEKLNEKKILFKADDEKNIVQSNLKNKEKQIVIDVKDVVLEEPLSRRISPPPPLPWQKKDEPAFYFDIEDEKEVNKIAQEKNIGPADDISGVADEVLRLSGFNFSDKQIEKVKRIITAFMQHIRSQAETREALTSSETRGASLSDLQADKLINLANEKIKDFENRKQQKRKEMESELDKILQQAEAYKIEDNYSIKTDVKKSTLVNENKNILPVVNSKVNDFSDIPQPINHKQALADEIIQQNPEFVAKPKIVSEVEELEKQKEESQSTFIKPEQQNNQSQIKQKEPEKIINQPRPIITRQTVEQSNRPKMADVKVTARTRGPIEQLRFLSLKELRRQRDDSLQSISDIKEKIESLEAESFTKKVEGIKAWRESPLYNLYVQIGRTSMETGKSVREVIQEKEDMNAETLTVSEFEKIMDLNKELRY